MNEQIHIIEQKEQSIQDFVSDLQSTYGTWENKNSIIILSTRSMLPINLTNTLLGLSKQHRQKGCSFVMVSSELNGSEIAEDIIIVPTIEEAHDIIDMEIIERDLGL